MRKHIIFILLMLHTAFAHSQPKDGTTLKGVTIATFDTPAMVKFYRNVFGVEFSAQPMYGDTLYNGVFSGIEILLCPAEIAENKTQENRHQFHIEVGALDKVLEKVLENGGSITGEKEDCENEIEAGIIDPDRNSIVLTEIK